MANINWEIEAREFGNCNCSYGCPCQFNALPTHGDCKAIVFYDIERGHFGDVDLSGLRCAYIVRWPGPVHEGSGECQIVVDARADARQRDALERIMRGEQTVEGGTMWAVFASVIDTFHEPTTAEIEFEVDVESRRAHGRAAGWAEVHGEPILNPVTGQPHRARIDLPHGFEYEVAEIGRGWSQSEGKIALDLADSYGQFCHLHLSNEGVVRHAA